MRATVAILLEEGHEGKVYTLTGPAAITQEQFAQLLSEVTGRSIQYVPISFDQLQAGLKQVALPELIVNLLVSSGKAIAQGCTSLVTDDVAMLTGQALEPYESVVRRILPEVRTSPVDTWYGRRKVRGRRRDFYRNVHAVRRFLL